MLAMMPSPTTPGRRAPARWLSVPLLVLLFAALPLSAQEDGPEFPWFLRLQAGAASYVGDQAGSFGFRGSPFAAGFDAGYRTSDAFSIGGGYLLGNYGSIDGTDEDALRHTVRLLLRYTFGDPAAGTAFYAQTGGHVTLGPSPEDGDAPVGGGPLLGAGLAFPISERASIVLDGSTHLAYPDDGVDGLGDDADPALSRAGGDFLTAISIGVELRFGGTTVVPPRVAGVEGPSELIAGSAGRFVARTNAGEATAPVEYRWDWGDGSSDTGLEAMHRFRRAGTYEVRFTASNEAGSASGSMEVAVELPVAAPRLFSIWTESSTIERGDEIQFRAYAGGAEPLRYLWDFGDGGTSTEPDPAHVFDDAGSHTVQLQVSNSAGTAEETMMVDVLPRLPRLTDARATPRVVPVRGPSVRFAAEAEGDEPIEYRWRFGDGEEATGRRVTHRYERTGTYTATVIAENGGGRDRRTVRVTVNPTEPPSIAAISTDRSSAGDRVVRFRAEVEGEGPMSYRWDFGDGRTGRAASPTHRYASTGSYTVTLVVSNGAGSDTREITVDVDPD